MMRKNISSGTKWESLVGYSRAVKVGQHIFVSGTTATDQKGSIVGKGDVYQQTMQVIKNIEQALRHAGGTLSDVVRTRIYVTDIDDWEAAGRAHSERFGDICPATSMIEVNRLIDSDMLVEIEAIAVLKE